MGLHRQNSSSSDAVGGNGLPTSTTTRRIVMCAIASVACGLVYSATGGMFAESSVAVPIPPSKKVMGTPLFALEGEKQNRRAGPSDIVDTDAGTSQSGRGVDGDAIAAPPIRTTAVAAAGIASSNANNKQRHALPPTLYSAAASSPLLYSVDPLEVPASSPLHRSQGAFIDDPSLSTRCSEQSAMLGDKKLLPYCPSLGYTDAVFAAMRRIADGDNGSNGGPAVAVPDPSREPLQMALDPLAAVPPLRYAVTGGRTTADMNVYYTLDDPNNRLTYTAGGGTTVSIPRKGAVHPSFEVYRTRAMRGAMVGAFPKLQRLIPRQKALSEMSDHRNAKAGVEDAEWVGGYTTGGNHPKDASFSSSAVSADESSSSPSSVPAISYKPLDDTRVFEFNGVHTLYNFDCVPDIDFRQYHQVRAASCIDHERLYARAVDVAVKGTAAAASSVGSLASSVDKKDEQGLQLGAFVAPSSSSAATTDLSLLTPNYMGLFPIVDEEYFEYSFTLAVAHDAAVKGRRFTFIELGARYGTWLVRAAAAYRLFYKAPSSAVASSSSSQLSIPLEQLQLMAVEGNCHWFRKMEEHVRCNGFEPYSTLLLSYAAPPSYNKVNPSDKSTFKAPRAVSIVQMLTHYVELQKKHPSSSSPSSSSSAEPTVDMIDFDIQGFETISLEHESGAVDMLTDHVGFLHFGTHGTEIETTLLRLLQPKGWCVVYFYAGAHTKDLRKGHRCQTPYGSSVFNDGAMGLANLKFYKTAFGGSADGTVAPQCPEVLQTRSNKKTAKQCYFAPQALTMIKRG